MLVMQLRGGCIIDIVSVFVRVSETGRPTGTDRLKQTDRDRLCAEASSARRCEYLYRPRSDKIPHAQEYPKCTVQQAMPSFALKEPPMQMLHLCFTKAVELPSLQRGSTLGPWPIETHLQGFQTATNSGHSWDSQTC